MTNKDFMNIKRESAKSMVGKGWSKIIDMLYDELPIPKRIKVYQVKEKFGCYDCETEVLTRGGWKYFKDLTESDDIATLKDGEILEYNKPRCIFEHSHSGKMYKLETRGVDILVTPNHKLYVASPDKLDGTHYKPYKRTTQPFLLETYERLYLKNKKFKKDVYWPGKEEDLIIIPGYTYTNFMKLRNRDRTYTIKDQIFIMDDFLDFLGWYIAEGCSDKKGNISIACNNTDGGTEKEVIQGVIGKIGYPTKTTLEDKSALVFRIYNTALAKWLLENCGHRALNKKIPDFIKELSPRQIRIVLNSLYQGDGHKTKTSYRLTTVSKKLSDDVQELILKLGDTFRESKYKSRITSFVGSGINPVYEISWMKLGYHNTQEKGLSKSSFEGLVDYEGKVYCVDVPNHIIYVKRGGKGYWCGNSLRFYTSGLTPEQDAIITKAERMSEVTCEECGKPGEIKSPGYWLMCRCEDCFEKEYQHLKKADSSEKPNS